MLHHLQAPLCQPPCHQYKSTLACRYLFSTHVVVKLSCIKKLVYTLKQEFLFNIHKLSYIDAELWQLYIVYSTNYKNKRQILCHPETNSQIQCSEMEKFFVINQRLAVPLTGFFVSVSWCHHRPTIGQLKGNLCDRRGWKSGMLATVLLWTTELNHPTKHGRAL